MKTLTVTQARKNLGQLCHKASRGEVVGIISGHQIFQLKPVQVVAWDDTYVAKEYGLTAEEADTFVTRADAEVARKEKRGAYTRFKGKFDPKSLA
jgi:antitoxin (DNA-binding transcriptional repressor) of toxin-antitoxin stability system